MRDKTAPRDWTNSAVPLLVALPRNQVGRGALVLGSVFGIIKNRAAGSNQQCGSLNFLVLASVLASMLASMLANATLGIFFRLEVLDFDLFLCWHFIFLSGWFVLLCPWRRRAIDARL